MMIEKQLRALVKAREKRIAELEAEVKALREFRNACVSLTGSLWPQNETTEYLSTLLQDERGK